MIKLLFTNTSFEELFQTSQPENGEVKTLQVKAIQDWSNIVKTCHLKLEHAITMHYISSQFGKGQVKLGQEIGNVKFVDVGIFFF